MKSCIPANAGNPPLKQPIKTPLPIKSPTCSSNQHLVNNVCVDRVFKKPVLVCAAGMHAFNGKCVPIKKRPLPIVTPPKKVKVCPVRTHPVGNTCVANPTKCLPPHKMQNGKCV